MSDYKLDVQHYALENSKGTISVSNESTKFKRQNKCMLIRKADLQLQARKAYLEDIIFPTNIMY